MKGVKRTWWLAAAMISLPLILGATQTEFWQVGTFGDFLKGNLKGVSLSKEGDLRLAPAAEAIFNPEQTLALSLTADSRGNLYVGTGHEGKVFRVEPNGQGKLLFQAPEPEILALAIGPDGDLYAASSPEGKIYRITPDGKSSVFYDPRAKYIWALAFDREGQLYVGTGDHGLILKIDPTGKGNVFFDSHQTHIMCLTFDHEGNLLAGSEPNGLVYRLDPTGKAFVLYQSNLPEIHSLATDSQGRIYAAALGGLGNRGTPQFFAPRPATTPLEGGVTTVTVTASTDDESDEADQPHQQPQPPPSQPRPPARQQPAPPSFNLANPAGSPFSLTNMAQGKGALIEILPDYSIETLWSSDRESIFGLAVRGSDIVFSTDGDGRIFELRPSPDGRQLTLMTETRESLATRLLLAGNNLYVATSNIAKLFRIGPGLGQEGEYESEVKDTRFVSRWGVLSWRGEVPAGTSLEFFTRSGNSERPDGTWSEWSGPYAGRDAVPIKSPPARYIQWKAVFKGRGQASPTLNDVTISYLNQNLAPEIRFLNVSTAGERTGPSGAPGPPAVTTVNGVTVSSAPPGTFDPPTSPAGPPPRVTTTISWQAEDPNGDQLVYSLYLKSSNESDWHLVKDKLHETSYTLDPDSLADGQYTARLVASDAPSNPPGAARQAELVSAPFWIDNSPPRIREVSRQVAGPRAEVHFEAETNLSPLRFAQISIDGGPWTDTTSDDDIIDSRQETFTVKAANLSPGEHVISLRVYDIGGNAGVGTAVVRIGR